MLLFRMMMLMKKQMGLVMECRSRAETVTAPWEEQLQLALVLTGSS
jgi:hypothetical protein